MSASPPDLTGRHLLLGVTGSIAAYKAAPLVRLFKEAGAEVQVLMTPDAERFITPLTLGTLSEREVLTEIFPENEEGSWTDGPQPAKPTLAWLLKSLLPLVGHCYCQC